MMNPPGWCAKYVGLPYCDKGRSREGFDCWGLVRHVLADEFGIHGLPDYVNEYSSASDRESVTKIVCSGKADGWKQVAVPNPGSVVILQIAGHPWHCGVVVNAEWMLHTLKGVDVCLERLDSPVWRNRIEGFYQYVG